MHMTSQTPDTISSKPSRGKIPPEILEYLASQNLSLPYTFQLNDGSEFCIRHLEKEDLGVVVRMCVKEFGSYVAPSSSPSNGKSTSEMGTFDFNTSMDNAVKNSNALSKSIQKKFDEIFTTYENFVFAFIVQLGLDQRIERRQKGEDSTNDSESSIKPDHNVLCFVQLHTKKDGTVDEEILGISEVSIQPLIPTRTAPPFILPLFIKSLLSQFDVGSKSPSPVAYVSNVLVKETKRGLGYGPILMATSEGRAKTMGFDELFLHVDANTSGATAQSLYWSLGFESFVEEKAGEESPYAWLGEDFVKQNRGLYLVDGVPLLYLRKKLTIDDPVEV